MNRILVLNFGGTSSKVSIYEDDKAIKNETIDYSEAENDRSSTSQEQVELRAGQILEWLRGLGLGPEDMDAYAVRLGGMFYGGDGGTFLVDGKLREHIDELYEPDKTPVHATRLTMALVDLLQKDLKEKRPSYATDPSSINQFLPEALITGHPLFPKRAAFHALNQRAVARKTAAELGKDYKDLNIIVVHAGSGVSIGAHEKGRIIDVNDSSGDGDGPFTPNRSGTLPTGQLMHVCYSGKYTEKEVYRMLKYEGGMKAYLGIDDLREVEKRIQQGDEQAELILKAMAYQISREVGACFAALCGEVDAIALTGGMSRSDRLTALIEERVKKIAPIYRYPGEFENEALALGAFRVLSGQEEAAVYSGEKGHIQPITL